MLIIGLAGVCRAGEPSGTILSNGKKATALVNVVNREFGSAFCVDSSGFFVTNAHVVQRLRPGAPVTLVIQPGEATQRIVQAVVARMDVPADLALLEVMNRGGFVALPLGHTDGLVETTELTAFGYPFGRMLGDGAANDYPSVTISTGKVTSLRKSKGELNFIQLDASLNPGNSGGPVVDHDGNVVGIVKAGVYGSGVNFAIPVEKLIRFLGTPTVSLGTPVVSYTARFVPVNFKAKFVAIGLKTKPVVTLILPGSAGGERKFEMKSDNDGYHVMAAPMVAAAGAEKLEITAHYSQGSISGLIDDRTIHLSGKTFKLSEVSRIDFQGATGVTLLTGTRVPGTSVELSAVEISFGPETAKLNLSKAEHIEFGGHPQQTRSIHYHVIVSADNKVLADVPAVLNLIDPSTGSPVQPPSNPTETVAQVPAQGEEQVPGESSEKTIVKVPSTIDDIVVGGKGRLLILKLKKLNQLAVYDEVAGRIAHYIPIPATDVLLAAGADELVVIVVDQKMMQIWNLHTFKVEKTLSLPVDGIPVGAAMGSASSGPLLLRWSRDSQNLASAQWSLINLRTNAATPLKIRTPYFNLLNEQVQMRASADGTTFGLWNTNVSPTGVGTITIAGSEPSMHYLHESASFVQPGADGSVIFAGGFGLLTPDLKKLDATQDRTQGGIGMFPCDVSSNYYIAVPIGKFRIFPQQQITVPASLRIVGNNQPLMALADMSELIDPENPPISNRDGLRDDKRVFFSMSSNVIVTVPYTNDQLIVRKFNLQDALSKSGIDYFFIASAPKTTAKRQMRYEYAIDVRSKRGGVQFNLDSAPPGMTISPKGVLTWTAPDTSQSVSVIVTVHDASGQEAFHSFTIKVD